MQFGRRTAVQCLMKSQNDGKVIWIILVFAVLATVGSWTSSAQVFGPVAGTLDQQAKDICKHYDAAFVGTVSSNWWNLLDSKPAAYDRGQGSVTLKFCLHSNGQVTDMEIAKRSVSMGDAGLCEIAVMDGVPYENWKEKILKALGTNCAVVTYNFEFN